MKTKTLLMLLVVFGALIFLSRQTQNRPSSTVIRGDVSPGEQPLADLDVNAVDQIEIREGTNALSLVRGEDGWGVEPLYGYPADFSAIASLLRPLPDLAVGQVMHGGVEELEVYDLAVGDASDLVRVVLQSGGTSRTLDLGALREAGGGAPGMGLPMGRFIRVDEGPVVLVDETFQEVSAEPSAWYQQDLTRVGQEALRRIEVSAPDGSYTVERAGGSWLVADLGDEEAVASNALNRITTALQFLRADRVVDPSLSDVERGMIKPTVFTAVATNNLVYTIRAGEREPEDPQGSIEIAVSSEGDLTEEAQAELDALNRRFEGWTFRVTGFQADALSMGRSEVIERRIPDPPGLPDAGAASEPREAPADRN